MRARGNHLFIAMARFALCAAALLLTGAANADAPSAADGEARANPPERWGFSFALMGGATTHFHKSTASSRCQNGGSGDPDLALAPCDFLVDSGPADLRPPQSGRDLAITPLVGGNLQVMTPAIEPVPGSPRFFVTGELNLHFPPERNVAIEGDADPPVRVPDTVPDMAFANTNTLLLNGVGSRTTSKIDTLGYGAAAGFAFPFEFLGRQLWIKPSIVWTRFEVEVEGLAVAGLKDDPVPGIGNSPPWGGQLREIVLSGKETLTLDGLGPGLELELEAGRYGPLGVSLFASLNTYKMLGDRKVVLRDTKSFAALPPNATTSPQGNPNGLPADTYDATWTFSTNPWMFRGGVGVRFQWLGN